jgi:hypothetical protein
LPQPGSPAPVQTLRDYLKNKAAAEEAEG